MRKGYVGIKRLGQLISLLDEIRRVATMKNSDFSDSIKKQTKLWRQSWIITPLDKVVKELKQFM